MSGKRIVQLLAAGLVLALVSDATAAPRKNRARTSDSSAEQSKSKDDSGQLVITGIELPKGVTLSDGYITSVNGEVFQPDKQAQADGTPPQIVVQAVRVDADGNPILPPPSPAATAALPDEQATDEVVVVEEESGGFFDFLFGPDEPSEEEQLAAEQAATQAELYADGVRYPDITPVTSSPRLGTLVSFNEDERIGVLWLDSRYLAFYGNEILIARDRKVEITGVFQMTAMRDSKATGLILLHGNPQQGDEIILPGPHYEAYINNLYDSGQIVGEASNTAPN